MSNIIWKGINSNTINGLLIRELPPISKPQMRTSITEIDGKDGDIVDYLGYKSYTKTISIGLTRNYDVNEIINYFNGSGKLILSNEPDKFYNAEIIDNIDYDKLISFKVASVNFYVQPYKYLLNEEYVEETITNQKSVKVINKGYEVSNPVICLEGTGIIGLYVNGIQTFTYDFGTDSKVVIDSENQDAYLDSTLKNRQMLGEFPALKSGENIITWSGNLTKIKIDPKSRWL